MFETKNWKNQHGESGAVTISYRATTYVNLKQNRPATPAPLVPEAQ
jgi:hypothetical protein